MQIKARQAAYLERLGVDVWVRRETSGDALTPEPTREPVAPPPSKPTARARSASGERPPTPATAPSQVFRIRCFRYGRVFVALAEDAWPWRRFLLDVARAMNGFAMAERQDLTFDWPLPGADPAAGDRAFRAFLGHQTRNGERSLISGERLLELLDTTADGFEATPSGIYVPPGAPDARTKRRLWRRIREL